METPLLTVWCCRPLALALTFSSACTLQPTPLPHHTHIPFSRPPNSRGSTDKCCWDTRLTGMFSWWALMGPQVHLPLFCFPDQCQTFCLFVCLLVWRQSKSPSWPAALCRPYGSWVHRDPPSPVSQIPGLHVWLWFLTFILRDVWSMRLLCSQKP